MIQLDKVNLLLIAGETVVKSVPASAAGSDSVRRAMSTH
jgi:hypothetical protein